MSFSDKVWLGWALYMVGGLIWFLVAELVARFNRAPGDTLSEVLWALHVPPVVWYLLAGLAMGTVAWLLPHIISKGKWGI